MELKFVRPKKNHFLCLLTQVCRVKPNFQKLEFVWNTFEIRSKFVRNSFERWKKFEKDKNQFKIRSIRFDSTPCIHYLLTFAYININSEWFFVSVNRQLNTKPPEYLHCSTPHYHNLMASFVQQMYSCTTLVCCPQKYFTKIVDILPM